MAQRDLTPTSYMILGLLTAKDWSAYEIAEQVGRGVAELWPSADRQRYNAPKILLERGLVTATTVTKGTQRSRTVYSITDEGRTSLSDWLATQSTPPALQFEGMIRVIFAHQGTIDDLRSNLTTMREQATQSRSLFVSHAQRISAPEAGTLPQQNHLMALANRFMIGHFNHIAEWADWALEETADWPDTVQPATTHRKRTLSTLAHSIDNGSS
ncbi:PadR family transcriptional regulator [Rhodococcus erythropolis]|uniref:PadR family transcriptional regulator n=1 Tax=Rhodococcus erythropolis TaxID=1833 RepID=UPI001E3AD9A8|nr:MULTISPECIES: PadR family transcriptional regulator [Rhodococcus erythropolis group]MCD2104304.1 PadR family transcriptional regulator [Rhodococcus qingshengii]MCZ4523357.1 PadR family transcriptional regulator [Rhodococcus erythropolis]